MSTRKGIGGTRSNVTGLVAVAHSATFGASSAVASQSAGTGLTLTNTGTGEFRVEFSERWSDFVVLRAHQVGGTLGGGTWECSSDLADFGSGSAITIEHLVQDGTPAAGDPPQEKFQFIFWMRNSTGGPTL